MPGRWTRAPKTSSWRGKTYDFFLVYAKKNTEQTYKMCVGLDFNKPQGLLNDSREDSLLFWNQLHTGTYIHG